MLQKIDITNFRKHRNLSLSFTSGMNTIRAKNEGGKSTIIEAISYALFGSRALRTPLESTVTRGEDVRSMEVTLTVEHGGRIYTFSRSKSGAEIVLDGQVFVTGQNEVSNFASQIVGADMTLANKLMFASQNSIRAAIEEGPKALSVLIESLAGMEVFDQLIETAQSTLLIGTTVGAEERLAVAEKALADELTCVYACPDADAYAKLVADIEQRIAKLKQQGEDINREYEALSKENEKLCGLYLDKKNLKNELARIEESIGNLNARLKKLMFAAVSDVNEKHVAELEQKVADAEKYDALAKQFRAFSSLTDGQRFNGSEREFVAHTTELIAQKEILSKAINEANMKMVSLSSARINADTCDKCGQGISHLDHVQEKNAQIDELIEQLAPQLIELEVKLNEVAQKEQAASVITKFAAQFATAIRGLSNVEFDDTTYPPKAVWVGPDVDLTAAPLAPYSELNSARQTLKDVLAARAQVAMLETQISDETSKRHDIENRIAAIVAPSEEEVLAASKMLKDMAGKHQSVLLDCLMLENEISGVKSEFKAAMTMYETHAKIVQSARSAVEQIQEELKEIAFNNALLKKLRALRPVITDKIWNTVLGSVSVMFSQVRCEKSLISKDKDGFKCNGEVIEGLSGSTLDALGLAIRCALIRTFIPECGLLILDEPAHGMDDNRTAAMLGFIQSIDMGQTILITHEDVSSSVASNIIELGD